MNKKWVGGIIVLLIIIGGWLYFQEPQEVATEPIRIGAILPLTGGLAKVGEDVQVAIEIAQEDLEGQYPNVAVIFEDDAFNPKQSVDVFNKLISSDNVDAILGPLNGTSISAIRPLAKEQELVAFTPWGAGNNIEGFTIKNSVEADDESRVIAKYAVQELGITKLAIMYLQNDFGITHYEAFRDEVAMNGGELVAAEPFEFGTSEYRTILSKIKASGAEGIFVVHNGAQVGVIAKQIRDLGIDAQLFGQYATESSDLISVGGGALEGLIYTFPINESNLTTAQKDFIQKFEEKVGGKPQVAAYNAYDIYTLLVQSINECGKDGVCVRGRILSTKGFNGVGGVVSFEAGRLVREFYFKKVQNGELVSIEVE